MRGRLRRGRAYTTVAAMGGPAALLRDSFTAADGTDLDAHTMDIGAGWTEHAGAWTISGNRARADNTLNAYASADAGQLNVDVSVRFGTAGVNNSGVVSRFENVSNCVLISLTGTLYVIRAGLPVDRGGTPITLADGDTLGMRWSGDTVTAHHNDTDLVTYTLDATEIAAMGTATRVGLRGNLDTTVRFDDFLCLPN